MRSAVISFTLAALALSGQVASANVICNPTAQLQELIAKTDSEPVFMGQGADKDISYIIIGDPNTGEWIAFAITQKGGKACNVANGFNFSIVTPKAEPKK